MDRNWMIRPVTEQDLPEITISESAIGPEPLSETQIREWEKFARTDKECPIEWLVAVEKDGSMNGRFLGFGEWGKAHWLGPDEREVHVSVPPAKRGMGVGTFILEHLETLAKRDNPKALFAWGRGYDRDSLKWAQNRGYVIERQRTEGILDLSGFDAAKFQEDFDRVKQADIGIITVWNGQVDPYLPGLHRVLVESFRDVPFRSPQTPDISLETWTRELKESSARKIFAIAIHDGQAVGFSDIWMPQMQGQSASLDYTGVLREFRGKGVAFAVKVASAAEAAKAGATLIRTNNDPDNPAILKLNQKMGFQPVPGPAILRKNLR